MHDIKYFILIKIIRQSRKGQQKFRGEGEIIEKYYFSKSRGGQLPSPGPTWIRP
jgi:hypothetical protein